MNNKQNISQPIDEPIIKIECRGDSSVMKTDYVSRNNIMSSECVISETECSDIKNVKSIRNTLRPSRLARTSIVGSDSLNMYAKPRLHFTGKGIVTKTQPGYSFTLKTRRGRKLRFKSNNNDKEEKIVVKPGVPIPDHDSAHDTHVPQISKLIKAESAVEGESYYFITKKKVRVFPKCVQPDSSHIHPNYYMDFKEEKILDVVKEEPDHTELQVDDNPSENQPNLDFPFNSFLNNKMFKRIGKLSDGMVECTLCFKQMKETSMKQHYKTHSGAKPYTCNSCSARFTRKGDVDRHRKTIHQNERPFECCMCERRFVERKGLISHLQNHDKVFYYTCTSCGFKFGKREYYENHIRFIHPLPAGQSATEVKDIVEKGLRQLEKLMDEEKEVVFENRRSSKSGSTERGNDFKLELCPDICIKEEAFDNLSDDSHLDPMSPESISQEVIVKDEASKDADCSNPDDDQVSVVKGTVSLTQHVSSQEDIEPQEEEELVNQAIYAAISQSQTALETIKSSIGSNMTTKRFEPTKREGNSVNVKPIKRIQPKSSEIHINATVGGNVRKFIVQIPSGSNIDATTQEGMDALVNMVNYLCSGKGELNGPVEVAMHHSI